MHRAGRWRRLPRVDAGLEGVEEIGEAAVIVGDAVLSGEPHALVVEAAQRSGHPWCDRTRGGPQSEEGLPQLGTEPAARQKTGEGRGVVRGEHREVALQPLEARGL